MNYDFRRELLTVHEADLFDPKRLPRENEFLLGEGATVAVSPDAHEVIRVAAEDFCEFLSVSMGISASVVTGTTGNVTVRLARDAGVDLGKFAAYRGFCIETDACGTVITAHDERGAAQALYYIEDLMTFEKAPVLAFGKIEKRPMYSPQMVHSAYGLDEYPDNYLARIAHDGRDAILLFVKDIGVSARGEEDFNDLIRRAARYGIDVYAYSKMKSLKHPSDAGAEEYYDSLYGELFRRYPGLKGVTLCGESNGFSVNEGPMGDWNTPDGIPTGKIHARFYPALDYVPWLNLVKKVIRRAKPDADIVFSTYNFGWCERSERLKLIEALPTDITLLLCFDMFEFLPLGDALIKNSDHSIRFPGPGEYFKSEAEVAHRRGIRLYAMTYTAGRTWDFGTAPYEPMPYQWMRRYAGMSEAQKKWGLAGIMECHHYSYFPSFISKLSKHAFFTPEASYEDILRKILKAEYGEENYEAVDAALRDLSEAITHYTPTNSDQYGAFRIGPSHPLNLLQSIKIPEDEGAMFGNRIWFPKYLANNNLHWMSTISPLSIRIREEEKSLRKMLALMESGVEKLAAIARPGAKTLRLLGLCRFLRNCTKTAIAAKRMHLLEAELHYTPDIDRLYAITDEIEALLREERENVLDTVPIVEADSSIGFEASMLYMCDKAHLAWKIRHIDYLLNIELGEIRGGIRAHREYMKQKGKTQ